MGRGTIPRVASAAWVFGMLTTGIPAGAAAEARLEASPHGLFIEVRGPVTLAGTAPLPLADLPPGRYRLTVDGSGSPRTRGMLFRGADDRLVLSRDNGPDALLLPPGLAHFRRGERSRGFVFLGTGLAFAGGALVQELSRGDAADDLARAQRRYDAAATTGEVTAAREALLAAENRAADEAEVRDLWVGAAAAVWLGAAMEAWLLTPKPDLSSSDGGRYVVTVQRASGFGAGLRSALVPGAGQRYMGSHARGNRFTAGVGLLGTAGLIVHDAYLEKRRDQAAAQRAYDAADTEKELETRRAALEEAADDADTLDHLQWAAFGLAGAVYLWNVLDAVQLAGSDDGANGLTWRLVPHGDGWRAGVSWRIG